MAEVTDNAAASRFELEDQGQTAFARYRVSGDSLYIDYVESPPSLRGTGTAGRLMEGVARIARDRGLTIVPICGYAVAWMKRHPDQAVS